MPYKYTGKEYDPETKLTYYGARYYDAKLSRWISVDPPLISGAYLGNNPSKLPGMGGVFNPINLDAYQYGGMNPVKYVDPDGNALNFLVGAAIGAVVGFTTETTIQTYKAYYASPSEDRSWSSATVNAFTNSSSRNKIIASTAGGCVTGAISTGASSVATVTTANAKLAQIAISATSNAVGSASSKIVENTLNDEKITNGLATSATIGFISGATAGALLPVGSSSAGYHDLTNKKFNMLYSNVAKDFTTKAVRASMGGQIFDDVVTASIDNSMQHGYKIFRNTLWNEK